MGCFDRVYITCPKCNKPVEFQSKAGRCWMDEYDESAVPLDIAADIDRDVEVCPNCKASVVAVPLIAIKTIAMHGVLEENYNRRRDDDD